MEPFNVLTHARHGQLLYNRHDVYIGRSLELYGEWSEGEMQLFQQVLRPGMVVVDAGANIGTHTVALARSVAPDGVVYAFEPQRIVFQTLAANVALNSLTNVFCLQRALGDAPGIARVPPLDYTKANNFGGVPLMVPNAPGEPVDVVRIDDLGLPACHLIKMDVEGMELAVLRGAEATIMRCQPLLYVEVDRAEQRDAIVTWLDEHGYVMYWHHVPLYNPNNFKGNPTNVFGGIVSVNMLAIPASVPQNLEGFERVAVPKKAPDAGAMNRAPTEAGPVGARFIAPEPEALRPMLERALAHHQAGRIGEAAALYEAVLAVQPGEPDALHLLGLVRRAERRLDDALALIGRAATLVPEQPLFHFNLGATRRQLGLLDEAEQSLRRTLALAPESVDGHLELGLTLLDRRELDAAEAALRAGLALDPSHAGTHFGLAGLLLLSGRFREGWEEYVWRERLPEFRGIEPAAEAPRWDGSPLDGRTILLDVEQGHGDTIQFARYVPLVMAAGGRVVLRCGPEIAPLLRTLDGVSQFVGPGEPLPPVDCVASLPDLPRLFGTTVETIPAAVPYLHADPARGRAWADRLDTLDGERGARTVQSGRPVRRVGLVWGGSPDHRLNNQRSTTLAALAPLGAVGGVRFYGLQKGAPAAEALTPPAGLDVVDLGPELQDFADTAAVISVLDLVITVDTSVGHLAGALGRPAWVLPWATHDWRWLLDRDDSPWYPSVRLFRQEQPHVWAPVVAHVAEALREETGDSRQETGEASSAR